eukprot:759503-Hanusia_phi.AAC.2
MDEIFEVSIPRQPGPLMCSPESHERSSVSGEGRDRQLQPAGPVYACASERDGLLFQVDQMMSRREEEWELLGAKAAESLVSKVRGMRNGRKAHKIESRSMISPKTS